MDIKIIVSTHKQYKMPTDETLYLPVQAGYDEVKEHFRYQGDNTGENISYKHCHYAEVSSLYWAWKNLDCDYLGLCHYRRYFTLRKNKKDKWGCILNRNELEEILRNTDVVLPKKRNYYIETTYSQYAHAHHAIDLDTTRNIISEKCPDYLESFDSCMRRTSGHKLNMLIMKRDLLDEYCQWLFNILFELEQRLDITNYEEKDSRVYGFVSERLLDVWLEKNNVEYVELPLIYMEKENWILKIWQFILRKIKSN